MKVTRRMLLITIAVLGVLLITYGLVRHFTDLEFGEQIDRWVSDIIIFSALGLFIYNRKLAKDEKLAKEAAEKAENQDEEEPEEEDSPDDENLPHWERRKNDTGSNENTE